MPERCATSNSGEEHREAGSRPRRRKPTRVVTESLSFRPSKLSKKYFLKNLPFELFVIEWYNIIILSF